MTTGGHRVSPTGHLTKGNDLEEDWNDTIWQKIDQDRHMWKQHAEVFAQPRDTMAAQL